MNLSAENSSTYEGNQPTLNVSNDTPGVTSENVSLGSLIEMLRKHLMLIQPWVQRPERLLFLHLDGTCCRQRLISSHYQEATLPCNQVYLIKLYLAI